MSGCQVTCGNCYQVISFAISELELKERPASGDYPNGFLMIKCANCDCYNPPSGMLDYESILKEWQRLRASQSETSNHGS